MTKERVIAAIEILLHKNHIIEERGDDALVKYPMQIISLT